MVINMIIELKKSLKQLEINCEKKKKFKMHEIATGPELRGTRNKCEK